MALNTITQIIQHELEKHNIHDLPELPPNTPTPGRWQPLLTNHYINRTTNKRTLVWWDTKTQQLLINNNHLNPKTGHAYIGTTNTITPGQQTLRQTATKHNPQDPNFNIQQIIQDTITWLTTP